MIPSPLQETQQLPADLCHAFQDLRGAFTELLSSVEVDAGQPQEVVRRFGLNKNLAWKMAKIVKSAEPHGAIPSIPGTGGLEIILKAFRKGGAPEAVVHATRQAMKRFDEMVTTHAGDRGTLNLMLTSMSPEKMPPEHVETGRKLAFQGNSSIWGLQARVRLASFFLAPNADDPTMLDTASMGGFLDVRRFRADACAPLFMRFSYNDDGTLRDGPIPEPIDPDCAPQDSLMLMRDFCSAALPELRTVGGAGYVRYELPPGPVGNTASKTWIYGQFTRRFASIYGDQANAVGEHAAPIHVPSEQLVCDLQVHKALTFALSPRIRICGQLGVGPEPYPEPDRGLLPVTERVLAIGSHPPIVATPLVAGYARMVQRVHERLGWNPKDFHGFRFVMKYPPMPVSVVFQHDLKQRP